MGYDYKIKSQLGKESTWGTAVSRTQLGIFDTIEIERVPLIKMKSDEEITDSPEQSGRSEIANRGAVKLGGMIRYDQDYFYWFLRYLLGGLVSTTIPDTWTDGRRSVIQPGAQASAGGITVEGNYEYYNKLATGFKPSNGELIFQAGEYVKYNVDGGAETVVALDNETTGNTKSTIDIPYVFTQGLIYFDDVQSTTITQMNVKFGSAKKEDDWRFGNTSPPEIFRDGNFAFDLTYTLYLSSDDEWDLWLANTSFKTEIFLTHADYIEDTTPYKLNFYMPKCEYTADPAAKPSPGGKRSVGDLAAIAQEVQNADSTEDFVYVLGNDGGSWNDATTEANSAGGTKFQLFNGDSVDAGELASTTGDYLLIGSTYQYYMLYFDIEDVAVGLRAYATGWDIKYYNGSAYAAVSSLYDGTSGFTVNGVISFALPTNWAAKTENSDDSAMYLQVNLLDATDMTTEPTINQIIQYTCPSIRAEIEHLNTQTI